MLFKEFGNHDSPTVILLHGGGLSYWSLSSVVDLLKEDYHVVTPVIDGHGEHADEDFVSIRDSASKLLQYIDDQCGGRVFALGGLSIGAQIAIEALSQRDAIAQYAILESALVLPMKAMAALTVPMYKAFYGWIKMKWFSRLQAKALFVPKEMLDRYYEDSVRMSKQSLINIALCNANYALQGDLEHTKAKALIIAGGRELGIMKASAELLHRRIPNSAFELVPKMGHGELSMHHPREYVGMIREFFA